MVKRFISLTLCVVMVFSFFSVSTIETFAAYNAKSLFTVKASDVRNGKISYTVNVTANQKNIGGIVLYVEYDGAVLNPVKAKPSETYTSGEGVTQNFRGNFLFGKIDKDANDKDSTEIYSIAYMNSVVVSTGSVAKPFFDLEFEVIDSSRPLTDVKFYCKEYYSTTESDKNISVSDGLQLFADYSNTYTLEVPAVTEVVPYKDGLKVKWESVESAVAYKIYRITPYDENGWVAVDGGEVVVESEETPLEYYDTGLVSGNTYTYAVSAINNYCESAHSTTGKTCLYVAKPEISEVKNIVGGIEITWSETKGAEFYNIMRRVEGEEEWTKIATRTASIERKYKDTSVEDGVKYEYDIVSATDTFTSELAEKGSEIIYVPAPQILSLTNTLSGIEIKWNGVKNATSYIIHRKAVGTDTTFLPYAEVAATSTSYTDSTVGAGKTYAYSVQAYTDYGDSGFNSNGYSLVRVPSTEVKSIVLNRKSVLINWAAVEGVNGYVIYRRNCDTYDWVKLTSVNSDISSYEDFTALSGGRYEYAVCPIMGSSEGPKIPSSPVFFIKTPEKVVAENIKEGIKVTWESVGGALSYDVMRLNRSGKFEIIGTVETSENLEYIDTSDIEYDKTYIYCVKAKNPLGDSLQSDNSNELLRIGSIGKTIPKLYKGGIKVTWGPLSGADKYAIFRNEGSGWVLINNCETNEYIDTSVESDVVYSYAVAAIIGDSRGVADTESARQLRYIAPPSNIVSQSVGKVLKVSWENVAGAQGYEVYRADFNSEDYSLVAILTAEQTSFEDKNIVAGVPYKYVVKTQGVDDMSLESDVVISEYLELPQMTKLTNTYEGVYVAWNKVLGADEYLVYRKGEDGKWTVIDIVDGSENVYVDKIPEKGVKTQYTIRARSDYGLSQYKAYSVLYVTAPTLAIKNTKKGVYLQWKAIEEADQYQVYRMKSNGGWTLLSTQKGTAYEDKKVSGGKNYTYTVRAVKGSVRSGYKSDGWSYRFLASPTHIGVENADGAVAFAWNKVAGATGYVVYRSVNGSGWVLLGKTKSTKYVDKNVVNKSNYCYTIRAYYGNCTSHFYTGKTIKYLTAPTLTVSNTTSSVKLSWAKISGASSYYVYRKAGSATKWTKIATVTKNYYNDSNVKSGTTYTYTIRAYGSKALSGYVKSGWKIVFLKTPKISSIQSKSNGVNIKWNKITGASGYRVYRKYADEGWVCIAKITSGSKVTFIDKKAVKGRTYYYTVRACKSSSMSTYYTNVKCKVKY